MRELGRRSEAAPHPYKAAPASVPARGPQPQIEAAAAAPLALVGKVGRREEIVAACPGAQALGIHPGMAATHARAMVSDLDFRPAEPEADAAMLDRLAQRIKESRDATFVTQDGNGNVVNRCEGIAFAGGAAFSSEEGYFATKVMRTLGVVHIEQQARV